MASVQLFLTKEATDLTGRRRVLFPATLVLAFIAHMATLAAQTMLH